MIPISRIYEPLCDIPEQSVVVLETGERVHFIRTESNEYTSRALPECRVKALDASASRLIHHSTPARYVAPITDYAAIAEIS